MSSFKRSRLGRLRSWFNHRIRNLFASRWIRSSRDATLSSVDHVRKTVAKTNKRVIKTVAESPVAAGAQQLARSGRKTERGFVFVLTMVLKKIEQCIAALLPAPLRRFFHGLIRGLWRAVIDVVSFVSQWFRTRRYWLLIGGIPAMILAMPLGFYLVRLPFQSSTAMAKRYTVAAQEAMHDKDYQAVTLYNRKLRQLGVLTESVDYRVAINDFIAGRKDKAIAAMKRLAPEDSPGFVPAHIWLANWYARFDPNKDSEPMRRLVTLHLDHALNREPNNPDALALRAAELHSQGQTKQALARLESIAPTRPEHRLTLVRLYTRQGRLQAARDEAQKLIDDFNEAEADELRSVDYLYWAEAHSMLRLNSQALDILEKGLAAFPDDEELVDRLYLVNIVQADLIRRNLTGEYDEMVSRLIRAHELKPDLADPLFRLAKLTQDFEPIGSMANEAVQKLLESDRPPQALFGLMGSIIGNAGDYEAAARYLDQAHKLDPQDAPVLNNLAYTLLKLGPSHHARGLELIDRALEMRPDEPSFHETRGQLLLSLGRYQEAVDALNLALNGLGDTPDIHRGLATAFRHLNEPDLAEKHAQMVE